MSIATVSSKGQITLPAQARRACGLNLHDRVLIETRGKEIVIRAAGNLMEWAGFLGTARPPREERTAMAREVAARTRGRP